MWYQVGTAALRSPGEGIRALTAARRRGRVDSALRSWVLSANAGRGRPRPATPQFTHLTFSGSEHMGLIWKMQKKMMAFKVFQVTQRHQNPKIRTFWSKKTHETGNKQMLLWKMKRQHSSEMGFCVTCRVSALLSVTVTRNPHLYSRLSQIVWGLRGLAAALSRGFMCVEMVTDLACAETVHRLFDPGCLPHPLLRPSHS